MMIPVKPLLKMVPKRVWVLLAVGLWGVIFIIGFSAAALYDLAF